jgi:hypothetical protein
MKTKEEIDKIYLEVCKDYGSKEIASEYCGFTKGYLQCQEDMAKDQTLTRFEVIDEYGRAYSDHYCKVELSYQDDGRTLKVFIKPLNKQD